MKALNVIGKILLGIAALIVLFLLVLSIIYSPGYIARYVAWNFSDIGDSRRFPDREIANDPPAFTFPVDLREDELNALVSDRPFEDASGVYVINDLDRFLEENDTTSFIVIKDDIIIYEKYFNGYTRDSVNTSFSVAKSVTSILVGVAVDEGLITSVEDPIVAYLPELEGKGAGDVTIRDLLLMSSGFQYKEGDLPWSDDPRNYYSRDVKSLALKKVIVEEPPGVHFLYNTYHPVYLGMILERVTGTTVSDYLEQKIWTKIGMEYPASWSMDSEKYGFEKMESGLNARSIDFAKLGRLFLNLGMYDGEQIISKRWVLESTLPMEYEPIGYYTDIESWSNDIFTDGTGYYKYQWWGFINPDGTYDYYAQGHLGQIIYVSPAKGVIIVRNGSSGGAVKYWANICREIAGRL
ncbi:MAG: serine hydrolase [Deltaproteobacteria bacterium]|nr:serine hydrolase [Candidatus Zymogenaceae bacterium]